MRKLYVVLVGLLLGCNIIPDGAGEDIPTSSKLAGINYEYYGSGASGTYSTTGDVTEITWNSLKGYTFKGIPNPATSRITKEGDKISSIEHLDSQDKVLLSFTFTYQNDLIDRIVVVTPDATITDVFEYDINKILQRVDRTRVSTGGTTILGLLSRLGIGDHILIDPYDPNAAGPGDSGFSSTGSANWINHYRSNSSWSQNEGYFDINKAQDGGNYDEYQSIYYTYTRLLEPFTGATVSMYMFKENYMGYEYSGSYFDTFMLVSDSNLFSQYGILVLLYWDMLKMDSPKDLNMYPDGRMEYRYEYDFE